MSKTIVILFVALLALSVFVVGCSPQSAAPATQEAAAGTAPATGDTAADAAIDSTVTDQSSDVTIGELI